MIAERYWTPRASSYYDRVVRLVDNAGPQCHQILWNFSNEAIQARDAEALCAVLRVADTITTNACDLRFAAAVAAMHVREYACAYAAWDDGGRTWNATRTDEGGQNAYVPTSRTAADVMMQTCLDLMKLTDDVPSTSEDTVEEEDYANDDEAEAEADTDTEAEYVHSIPDQGSAVDLGHVFNKLSV
jgi:hypothetical protein